MKNQKIKVIVKEVGKEPEIREINNNYESLNKLVGGYIEFIGLTNKSPLSKYSLMVNEEGKLLALKPNFHLGKDVVFGTAVIIGCDDEGENAGIDECHISFFVDWFKILPKCKGNEKPEDYMGFSFIPL